MNSRVFIFIVFLTIYSIVELVTGSEVSRNDSQQGNNVFVFDRRLLNTIKVGRAFVGEIRYGSFKYNANCPNPGGLLTGIDVYDAPSTDSCFLDNVVVPTKQISYICVQNEVLPSTIHFGIPSSLNGFIIGGTNFVEGGEAIDGYSWRKLGVPTYTPGGATATCEQSCVSTFCGGTCTATCTGTKASTGEKCDENTREGVVYFALTSITPKNCGILGSCCIKKTLADVKSPPATNSATTSAAPTNSAPTTASPTNAATTSEAPTTKAPQPKIYYAGQAADCDSIYKTTCDYDTSLYPTNKACFDIKGKSSFLLSLSSGVTYYMKLLNKNLDSVGLVLRTSSSSPPSSQYILWSIVTFPSNDLTKCSSNVLFQNINGVQCTSLTSTPSGYYYYCEKKFDSPVDLTTGGPYYLKFKSVLEASFELISITDFDSSPKCVLDVYCNQNFVAALTQVAIE